MYTSQRKTRFLMDNKVGALFYVFQSILEMSFNLTFKGNKSSILL